MPSATRSFYLKRIVIFALTCYALFFFGNRFYHITDPDEAFYVLTAHEMAAQHEWLTPYIFDKPQFEKPPLTYWLLELAFKNGGESPFTARFFPAFFASLGVLAVYWLGLMGFRDERKAFFSAIVLATGAFYVSMGKMVFTDMIFTVFILLALTMFVWGFTDRHKQALGFLGFYLFCALATLAKTPLGFVIAQMTVVFVLLYQRQLHFLKSWWVPAGLILYGVIALPWYLYAYHQYGHAFTHEFFYNDHWRRFLTAEHPHNDHWFFYPLTMVLGSFPWSLFVVAAAVDLFKRLKNSVGLMDYLALSWIVAVLLVFQMAHSKLTSYILPLFPALALMTGNFLSLGLSQIQQRRKMRNLLMASFAVLVVLGIVAMAGHKVIRHYLSSTSPMFFLSGALLALAGIGMTLSLKERFEEALYVLALTLVPLFTTAFMTRTDIEGYVSSWEYSSYIPPRAAGETMVLSAKNTARGLRYYTGQEVAVIDSSEAPFFSPHPIPILDTKEKLLDVLSHQPVTYGVLRKNAYKDLLKDCGKRFHVFLLKSNGFYYIVKILPS